MRAFNPQCVPRPNLTGFDFTRLNAAPLDLEIGAGQGLHAIQYCTSHPGRTLVALERTKNRFALLSSRAAAHSQLTNLIIARADAVAFVAHFVADATLDRVFLYYPNPNPKASNLRWHRSPFIAHLRRKMKPGASLHLATNLQWYAAEAAEWMPRHGLNLRENRVLGASHIPRTHFERKYLARGESCFDLVFENGLQ